MTKDIEKISALRKKLAEDNPRLMTLVKTVEELRFSNGFSRKQIFISMSVILLDFMKKSAIEDDKIQLMRKLLLGISKEIPDSYNVEKEEESRTCYYATVDG